MSKKSKLTSSLNSLFWIGVCLLNIACAQRKPSIAIGNNVKKPSTEAPKPPASNPGETPSNSYPEFLLPHVKNISFGAILPSTALITVKRAYRKKLVDAIETLTKGRIRYNFPNHYRISDAQLVLISLNPSPTEVLNTLCELVRNVSTIIYMTNSEVYGHNAASTQYLMQLTGYLGIPVIAWNADNTGFHHSVSETRILQLAPSLEHQASAILSILQRYSWRSFSIVTGDIGGHNDFVRAVRDQLLTVPDLKFTILDILNVKARQRQKIKEKLEILAKSEARVVLLYSSKRQAQDILAVAKMLNLTGRNYMWIGTQSVVGLASEYFAPDEYLPGMLGIHFNTTHSTLLDEMEKAVTIFGNGLENFVNDGQNLNLSLTPSLTCDGSGVSRWHKGDVLYRYLRNVSIPQRQGKGNIEFNVDGTLKFVELEVMNLNENYYWERIGVWTKDGLEVKDITWPDKSPVPPQGVPERFSLRVSFLEEPSFVNYVPIDEATGKCKTSRAVKCRYAPSSESLGINKTGLRHGYDRCCSGFCIDLLQKFATDLKFNYELRRVEDGTWGALNNGTWNGLIADLLNNKADVVATSIKINSDRQKYVEFTVPFLETGITILVAKRTGIISPKAFLEPFDVVSWIMILLISIQVAAFAIFLFEWLSPSGYNMRMKPTRDHKFSLFRTYWLVWAILFGAAVPVNCPRGYTARFMSNVWATFAVVFLAIYTANLAAFMITREDFYDFTGLDDPRLANPHHTVPPLKFGTIPHGNTESVLKRNKPKMQAYMQKYNRSSSLEGVKAVKKGELDAFIYDAVVLDYLTGQDTECRLLTVGSWYAMTGYGFAFPKKSKYLAKFNEKMIEYRENGDLERLRKFWFQGACKPSKRKGKLSKPLDVNQFMSAFLLLGCGVLLTVLLLGLEHFYFRYCRRYLSKTDKDGCFTLVSLSMANSLTFQTAVVETQEMAKEPCCSDPVCSNHIWRLRKELDLARERLREYQESERTTEELLQQPSINHELKLCTKEDLDLDCQKSPYWALPCFSAYNPPSGNPQVLHRSRDITRNRVQTNDTQVKDSVSRYQQDTSHGPCKGTTTPEGKCLRGMFSKAAVAEIETVL